MKPLVSINTITYNHAPYIRQCIEGVLMQKTTFPFELLIGEDCSTDGTRGIVLEYAQKYPEIIRMITSEFNVGAAENIKRTNNACRGEFVAFCEGDDCWIDPLKLQKQYEALNKFQAVMVTHNTIILKIRDAEVLGASLELHEESSRYLDPEDIILLKTNIHSSSFFILKDILLNLPGWYYQAPVFDIPCKMIAVSLGKVYFLNEVMSIYRRGVSGSWTVREKNDRARDVSIHRKFVGDYLGMYKNYDNFTDHRFYSIIRERIKDFLSNYIFKNGYKYLADITEGYEDMIALIIYLSRPTPKVLRDKIRLKVASYLAERVFQPSQF